MKRTPFEKIYPKLNLEDKAEYLELLYTSGLLVPRSNTILTGNECRKMVLEKQKELLEKYNSNEKNE